MYKRLEEIQSEFSDLREKGRTKGKSIGWDYDKLPVTIKEGTTTFIAAAPASGKTEIWFEILINLSCLHGWKHIIFSPETGDSTDVYAELCHKFVGKAFIKGEYSMSEAEKTHAEMFINEHFVVVDPKNEDLTIMGFYDLVDQIELDTGLKFNTTTIDPWNELTEEYLPEDLGREDKYLSRILGKVRKNARATNRHNCIINHVRDQALVNQAGITYFPMPHAREMAGGQVWFRKGLLMLIVWRPPYGLSDDSGAYEMNETHLKVAKSKPKGVSKNGTYKLYLDLQRYQYYLKDEYTGARIYADRGEHSYKHEPYEQKKLEPNKEFFESDWMRIDEDETPF